MGGLYSTCRDQSGVIGAIQIQRVLEELGWKMKKSEVEELINQIDEDMSGDISFNEFVWLMTK